MATLSKLLCISSASKRNCNELEDIVGVFQASHVFSPAEIKGFTIIETVVAEKDIRSKICTETETITPIDLPKYTHKISDEKAITVDGFIKIKQETLDAIVGT